MLKMIEIIGSSEISYSDAVKGSIQKLIDAGEKIHFFKVVEQRGAVREGRFKEFQVVIKVAVE